MNSQPPCGVAFSLEPALKMYHAALDSDTPAWAKAAIFGTWGYFISPVDTIPDSAPVPTAAYFVSLVL
jgi:uncharacterized membrane protein YkvA (DUF1232 family)